MMDIQTSFKDTGKIEAVAEKLRAKIAEKVKPLNQKLAEDILEKAKQNCPVSSGALYDSAYIEQTDNGYRVGFSVDYALIVHEQPQSYRDNGQRHFLSDAVEEVAGKDNEKIKEMLTNEKN